MAKNGGTQDSGKNIDDHIMQDVHGMAAEPAAPAPAPKPITETLGARRARLGLAPGKSYNASPDTGTAGLNPLANWRKVIKGVTGN